MIDRKKNVIVYNGATARHLLRDYGDRFRIVDVAPNRHDPDRKASVFIFAYTDGIYEAIKEVAEKE